jgi:hypothetical protein
MEETMATPTVDCALCIDGFMPAGTRPILGPVYKPCPTCSPACQTCNGSSVLPADIFGCVDCFISYLAGFGLTAIVCPHCIGLVDLVRTDTLPEVTGHDHT